MSAANGFSREAKALAHKLIKEERLTMRQLQQGIEWSSRNSESLLTFLDRFCSLELGPDVLGAAEVDSDDPPRRQFERHPSGSGLWLEVYEKLVEVSALNVSRGGLAFRSRWALEIGTQVLVGVEQRVAAIVRYCVDDGPGTTTIGAEFEPRTVDDLQAIEELMSSLTTRVVGTS